MQGTIKLFLYMLDKRLSLKESEFSSRNWIWSCVSMLRQNYQQQTAVQYVLHNKQNLRLNCQQLWNSICAQRPVSGIW